MSCDSETSEHRFCIIEVLETKIEYILPISEVYLETPGTSQYDIPCTAESITRISKDAYESLRIKYKGSAEKRTQYLKVDLIDVGC